MKAAREIIPKHESTTQRKRIMSYELSMTYNDIAKLTKIFHKFHNKKLKQKSYPDDSTWDTCLDTIKFVAANHSYELSDLAMSLNGLNIVETKKHLHRFIQTLMNKAKIEIKLDNHERMKRFIQKRCKDFTESPGDMISSLLERKKWVINLDRVIVKDANNNDLLVNDSFNVKKETINHFQNIAQSTYHNINDHDPDWLTWQSDYEPRDDIDNHCYDGLIELPSLQEWLSIVTSLSNDKVTGTSGISNEMLKHIGSRTAHYLWLLIRACLQLNDIPQQWKEAYIYPIPKPKEWQFHLANTRPITLLETTRKAMVKMLTNRLMKMFVDNNILKGLNFAGLPHQSTFEPLRLLDNVLQDVKDSNKDLFIYS